VKFVPAARSAFGGRPRGELQLAIVDLSCTILVHASFHTRGREVCYPQCNKIRRGFQMRVLFHPAGVRGAARRSARFSAAMTAQEFGNFIPSYGVRRTDPAFCQDRGVQSLLNVTQGGPRPSGPAAAGTAPRPGQVSVMAT
jgi:hypothetical protein